MPVLAVSMLNLRQEEVISSIFGRTKNIKK
jgi:hypothetical protein